LVLVLELLNKMLNKTDKPNACQNPISRQVVTAGTKHPFQSSITGQAKITLKIKRTISKPTKILRKRILTS